MSKKQGFQNCPSITEFKVGMDIRFDRWNRTVVFVDEKWNALTQHRFSKIKPLWVTPEQISSCELDLDSLWKGREYEGIPRYDGRVRVLLADDFLVAFSKEGYRKCWPRPTFLERYKPLPLSPPAAEAKPAPPRNICSACQRFHCPFRAKGGVGCGSNYLPIEPAPPEKPWQPIKGDKVLFGKDVVEVLAVWGDVAWIPRGGTAETVGIDELRPLPAEPPVKKGDVIFLEKGDQFWFGRVVLMGLADGYKRDQTFVLDVTSYSCCCWDWDEPDIKITHLVPADSKAAGE